MKNEAQTQVNISYKASVFMPRIGDWRSVWIDALATPSATGKMLTVEKVIAICGEEPTGRTSRTGSRRQVFNASGIAEREIGKRKRASCVLFDDEFDDE